jgi:PAS domain S-box-containing protein
MRKEIENLGSAGQALAMNYRFLFDNLPRLMILLSPDPEFRIITATDSYLKTAFQKRDDIAGKSIFECFPDNNPSDDQADGADSLRASLMQCLETREAASMPIQKYSHEISKGNFRTAYWSVRNSPILDHDGKLLYIIHEVEDVSDYVNDVSSRAQTAERKPNKEAQSQNEIEVYLRATEVQKANKRLRSREEKLLETKKELLDKLFDRTLELEKSETDIKILFSALKENQEWLAATLRSIGDAVIATSSDSDAKLVFMNSVAEKLTGWKFEDARGKPIAEILNVFDKSGTNPIESSIVRLLRTRERTGISSQSVLKSKTHDQYIIEDVAAPIVDTHGEISGIVLVFRDITDRELNQRVTEDAKAEVENERENFRKLFRQTPEMVCILFGPEHTFEFVNKAHAVALGFDATGMTVREAQPESIEVHGILDEVYRTGITAELREIPVTVGPKLRYFNLTYAPRFDVNGHVNGVMILGSEITGQFEARETMIKAKEFSEAANASKSAFIANMSHEIRTPIGVIRGFCELLQDDDISPAERHEYLSRIVRNTKGLTRIIDDILDLAKVEAGKLEVEEITFSLKALIYEVMDMFVDIAREKNIELELLNPNELPEAVSSDPTRLRQILINIVGNALKFTSSGSVRLEVKSSRESTRGLKYEIRVIDSGIGLTQSQADRLFQPFVQADGNTNRLYGGTGLGLVISRRLADALGGSIEIENFSEGAGCTFVISFYDGIKTPSDQTDVWVDPKVSELRASAPQSAQKILSNLHILVADDSIDNQMLVKRILSKNGATVELASNGEEAFEKGMASQFDLVLMDLQMPMVDGYEATRRLRAKGFTKPIVALTAHAMLEERAKTKEAGCNAHLTKPINSVELIETIKSLSYR